MKRILTITLIFAIGLFADTFTAYSQSRRGVVTASTTVVTRTRVVKEKKKREPIKIRWQNNVDATVGLHYDATYTGGWRFGNFFFLGFGTGVQVYPHVIPYDDMEALTEAIFDAQENDKYYNPSRIAVPLDIQMRFRFMKTKVAPYLSMALGILFQGSCESDLEFNPDRPLDDFEPYYKDGIVGEGFYELFLGVDIRLKNTSSLNVGVGILPSGQSDILGDGDSPVPLGIRLGYSF